MSETPFLFFPRTADRLGAIETKIGFGNWCTHGSRTMMFDELAAILSDLPATAEPASFAEAVIDSNRLAKQTTATRRATLRHLRELYALDTLVPLYRIFRRLWDIDPKGRQLLALLLALARDPLLTATAPVVVSLPEGAEYQRNAMRNALLASFPDRMNESTLDKVARNTASSWAQSGHLQGRTFKLRRRVSPTPAAVAFALYIAHGAGFSIQESFICGWLRVLDCELTTAIENAALAKRLGLIDFRMAGNVIDLQLERLDPLSPLNRQMR
jgi:hypothetical protein